MAERARRRRRPRGRRAAVLALGGLVLLACLAAAATLAVPLRLAGAPDPDRVAAAPRAAVPAYDVMGHPVGAAAAARLLATPEGRRALDPDGAGAVEVTPELLARGEEAFYAETFGNEVFMTDVLGVLEGPLSVAGMTRAVVALRGRGTANLRVPLAEAATVGGRRFERGELIDTGLDVPKGGLLPLGLPITVEGGRVRAGIACAACHSSVDPMTFEIVHGAANVDFNAGLLIALGSNTAAYFAHGSVKDVGTLPRDPAGAAVALGDGRRAPLPDPAALEDAVDRVLLAWPPGSFDSTGDFVSNPTHNPDSFTWGDHPFSFSGAFAAGPFNGLAVQTNNVHALNSDATTQAAQMGEQAGIDRELYLAVLLRNAAKPRLRWDPAGGEAPSAFLARVDPTPMGPSINASLPLPTYPDGSLAEGTGLWMTLPGEPVWYGALAMSAWQNTLLPPPAPLEAGLGTMERGRSAFERAGCGACHGGPALTNNQIVPQPELGTSPGRATALAPFERTWSAEALGFGFGAIAGSGEARPLAFPTDHLDPEQVRLAWAFGGSPGGYKVPSLVGLWWSPPYLHDAGAAVGPDGGLGAPGTSYVFVPPDPRESVRALLDRGLRARVVAANRADPRAARGGVTGEGHAYWVDAEAGFSADEQEALVAYLLAYVPPEGAPLPNPAPPPPSLRAAGYRGADAVAGP